jgi:hypothetical protein
MARDCGTTVDVDEDDDAGVERSRGRDEAGEREETTRESVAEDGGEEAGETKIELLEALGDEREGASGITVRMRFISAVTADATAVST